MDDFLHLLEEHARDPWPDSVGRGTEYGGVELVMADADICGWAIAARDLRLTPDVRSRLRERVDSLDHALDVIPEDARPYFERLVRLGRGALGDSDLKSSATQRPEHVLLNAYRVLHGRGAHRIQAAPYFYATGHWRCSTLVDGEPLEALKYTNGMQWHLPGLPDAKVVDAEKEADAIWAALTPEQQEAAVCPDPAYVVWFSALLDACGETVPALWDDYDNYLRDGYVWIGTGRVFPLPPGDSLRRYV